MGRVSARSFFVYFSNCLPGCVKSVSKRTFFALWLTTTPRHLNKPRHKKRHNGKPMMHKTHWHKWPRPTAAHNGFQRLVRERRAVSAKRRLTGRRSFRARGWNQRCRNGPHQWTRSVGTRGACRLGVLGAPTAAPVAVMQPCRAARPAAGLSRARQRPSTHQAFRPRYRRLRQVRSRGICVQPAFMARQHRALPPRPQKPSFKLAAPSGAF